VLQNKPIAVTDYRGHIQAFFYFVLISKCTALIPKQFIQP